MIHMIAFFQSKIMTHMSLKHRHARFSILQKLETNLIIELFRCKNVIDVIFVYVHNLGLHFYMTKELDYFIIKGFKFVMSNEQL